jgi:hypothetical protein
MNQTITPKKATSFGILFVALWLIVMGIWHIFELIFSVFWTLPPIQVVVAFPVSWVGALFLIVLWKTLPLVIGLVLFRQHRSLVRWFYGYGALEDERDSWDDTALLATFLAGLLGLFLFARALSVFCSENQIWVWILAVENKTIDVSWNIHEYLPILYPLILGFVFIAGAGRIGAVIGRAIDKSLANPIEENPTEKKEDDSL